MKLHHVSIKRYRSAENVEVSGIGEFNVFIGKNNSGKSTLLSAIQAFYRCIKNGNVISLAPGIGKALDFSNHVTALPIEIGMTFSLELAERDSLIRDIAEEAPQLKNAVDGLDPSLKLQVALCIVPPPKRFSYIESISLVGNDATRAERLILKVGLPAARELSEKVRTSNIAAENDVGIERILSSIDEDDFRRFRREPTEVRTARLSMMMSRRLSELPAEISHAVDSMWNESTTFADFQSGVSRLRQTIADRARSVQEQPLKNTIETFSGDQASIPTYVKNLIQSIAAIKVLYLTEQRRPVGKEEAQRLLSFKVTRGGQEALQNVQQTVTSLLGVQIDAFESSSTSGEKGAEMDVDNFLLEVNGSGIREALRLLLDVEFQHPGILLVEEPEVHLHPALETNMMRYLKRISRNCQVFISTHSTNLLDTAEMKNVYLISKPKAHTELQRLNLEEAEARLPKELGVRLSSLFMFDRLVFVEGPSDEAILREWANTLNINLSQSNTGFISMGGVRNFAHYATETIFSFLTKRQVKVIFIIDKDERDDEDIKKLTQRLKDKATVAVLQRREIENYLIVPRALTKFIELKQQFLPKNDQKPAPSQDAIKIALNEVAEELRTFSIGKRAAKILCAPIYPSAAWKPEDFAADVSAALAKELATFRGSIDKAEGRIEAVVKEQTDRLQETWDRNKLEIVPGDILLDRVCGRFGARFKKDVDGAKLASMMSEGEIEYEIQGLIRKMGS